jgi:predicted metal-dependent enzyme (double-stranded beta helix superfamily)
VLRHDRGAISRVDVDRTNRKGTGVLAGDVVERLRAVRWDDLRDVTARTAPLLSELVSSPHWLARAYDHMVEDDHLRSLSERLAELDKLVLWDDPASGVRVRMHVFRQGYFDRPHNHRFTFGTVILSGGYTHTVYGQSGDSLDIAPDLLVPRLIKFEGPGSSYVIEHSLVHSVAAATDTVTLTVRGPSCKDRMLIVDDERGPFWAVGVKDEDPVEVARRRLTDDRLGEIRVMLARTGLLAGAATATV